MMDQIIHIPVGSGYLFAALFTGAIPDDATIEAEANRIGYIEKGATCEYKPTTKALKDDYGKQQRTVLTDEEVTFKASLIAWSSQNLDKFALTGRVTEANGHRTIKIGGLQNFTGQRWLWRFVHPDAVYGTVRLTIVGTNTGGFTLTYQPDAAGNMDVEVTAEPNDDEGTLILYDEEVLGDSAKASGLSISSAAGSTSGATKLTVTPVLIEGDSYRIYKTANVPALGAVLSTWAAWDGTSDIAAATGDVLTVAEVDSANKAVKAGVVTVTAMA